MQTEYVAFLLVAVLATAVALLIISQIFAYQDYPFDTDEASHALGGLRLATALLEGDLTQAANVIDSRDFYPPALDAPKALAFLLWGATPLVGRLFSVVCLFLAVLVIYALCVEIDPRMGWLAGIVAAVLTLSMQPLLVNSGLMMLEAPGLLITLLWLWATVRALKRPSNHRLLIVSLLLALLFLTKYTYGVVALTTAVLLELTWLVSERSVPVRRLFARWLWFFGPLTGLLLLWFGRSARLATFLDYTRPLAEDAAWLSLDNLLFYPRSLALHNVPGPLFVLVTFTALIWAATRWHDLPVRLLLLYFTLGMVAIILINHPPNPRFIVTFVPAAHVLTGMLAGWLWRRWRASASPTRLLAGGGLAAVGLAFLLSLPLLRDRFLLYPSLMASAVETEPDVAELADWLSTQIPQEASIFLVNYWDQFSPATLTWHLDQSLEAAPGNDTTEVTGALLQPASTARVAALRIRLLEEQPDYLVLLEGSPWGAPFWPAYTAALENLLEPVAQADFRLNLKDSQEQLEQTLLTRENWPEMQQNGRYALDVRIIIYAVQS